MTNEQQQSPIFCLDKLKKHLYNTIWGIKQLLMGSASVSAHPCRELGFAAHGRIVGELFMCT
jgi:hypothetical protein